MLNNNAHSRGGNSNSISINNSTIKTESIIPNKNVKEVYVITKRCSKDNKNNANNNDKNNNINVNNSNDNNNNNNENKQSSKTTFYRQQNKNSNDIITTELNFDNANSNLL